MALWDRVSGAPVRTVPADALPGRHVADDAGDLAFGMVAARLGDRLLAGPDGHWSVVLRTGRSAGRFAPSDLIEDAGQAALDELADELGGDDGVLCWASLGSAVPFRRPRPEQLEPTGIDRAISVHGPHLLEVARSPYTQLDAVVEPARPSRARRIPPRAIEHLAEHSEDWQRRTVNGVIPRRVLSQHAEELLDVYENRVVARTVDRLLDYLGRRAATLDAYQRQLDPRDVDDLGGPHWLARRLAALWGTTFDVQAQREQLEQLQDQLRLRRRHIGKLKDAALYRAVPELAAVGGRLRMTNVLMRHQHYRRVAALWQTLAQTPALSVADAYGAAQRRLRAFDAFALLLIANSLHGLGYAASDEEPLHLTAPGALSLQGPRGLLTLTWDPLRGVTLGRGDAPLLRLVPLAARLAGAGANPGRRECEALERRLHALLEQARASDPEGEEVVVLYAGQRDERPELPDGLAHLLNPPDAGLASAPSAVLPVSPLDLYSAERVDRVVRRAVLIDLLGQGSAELLAREAAQVGTADRGRTADRAPDDALDRLRTCPTCGADGELEPWTEGNFLFTCAACGTSWGLRPCAACQAGIPFLKLNPGQRPERRSVAASSERLDREYGRDLLAVPRADGEESFCCPSCGA